MNIIGRSSEIAKLDRAVESNKPEFIVTYGRRRVGKTYLIRNYFKEEFRKTSGNPRLFNCRDESVKIYIKHEQFCLCFL